MTQILDVIARVLVLICAFDWKTIFSINQNSFGKIFNENTLRYIKVIFGFLYLSSVIWIFSYSFGIVMNNNKEEVKEKFDCGCEL